MPRYLVTDTTTGHAIEQHRSLERAQRAANILNGYEQAKKNVYGSDRPVLSGDVQREFERLTEGGKIVDGIYKAIEVTP